MSLTPAMAAALDADRVLVTLLVRMDLPGRTVRLLFGSGTVAWDSGIWSGRDSVFGSITAIEEIEENGGEEAPSFSFTLAPPSDAAAADLSSAEYQGSLVRVWLVAIVRETGQVVADPHLIMALELDVTTLNVAKGERTLDIECVSAFERFFENDEGIKLSDASHQEIWPGETGFANVTGVTNSIFWGTESPSSSVTVASPLANRLNYKAS